MNNTNKHDTVIMLTPHSLSECDFEIRKRRIPFLFSQNMMNSPCPCDTDNLKLVTCALKRFFFHFFKSVSTWNGMYHSYYVQSIGLDGFQCPCYLVAAKSKQTVKICKPLIIDFDSVARHTYWRHNFSAYSATSYTPNIFLDNK